MASAELSSILKPIEKRKNELQAELDELREEEGEVRAEMRTLERVLRAADPSRNGKKNGNRGKAGQKHITRVSPEREDAIVKILKGSKGPLTVGEAADKLKWPKPTANFAMAQARAAGRVRLVRQRKEQTGWPNEFTAV